MGRHQIEKPEPLPCSVSVLALGLCDKGSRNVGEAKQVRAAR